MTQDGGRLKGLGLQPAFRETNREQRRKRGIYYTPKPIARFMAHNVLARFVTGNKRFPQHVKVMDLSCGDGILLEAVVEEIGRIKENIHIPENFRVTIAGIDTDAFAVKKAKENIQKAVNKNLKTGFLVEIDVKCKDALDMVDAVGFEEDDKYNIIIGNPPYIPWYQMEKERRTVLEQGRFLDVEYCCRPNHKDAQPNSYLFFSAKASSMVADDGIISLLLPIEWLYHERARDFRNYLASRFKRIELCRFSSTTRLFDLGNDRAGTTSMILTLDGPERNGMTGTEGMKHIQQVTITGWDPNWDEEQIIHAFQQSRNRHTMPFTRGKGQTWIFAEPRMEDITRTILQPPVARLEDQEYFDIRGGFQPPVHQAKFYEISQEIFDEITQREQQHVFPLVHDANEIKRYILRKNSERYWILANEFATFDEFAAECPRLSGLLADRIDVKVPGWWRFPNIRNEGLFKTTTAKILTPRTANKPTFALDDKKHVFKGTNTMIVSKILNPKYVLGVLNSEISLFWHHQYSFGYHGGMVRKFEPAKVRLSSIPVKMASTGTQRAIIERVTTIIDLLSRDYGESSKEVSVIQKEVDDIVYNIYGISNLQREEILSTLHS